MTDPTVTAQKTRVASVDEAIRAAVEHLRGLQADEGYWWAELDSNVTMTAEHVFLRHILGIPDPEEATAAAAEILSQQRDDGTWANWHDGPGDLSTTAEAYLALKMAGISVEQPEMQRAREFILSRGGVGKVRVFTKIWLAMMGEWDWRGLPTLPAEFVLLPRWFPASIYSFACWARQTIVPMSIIMDARLVVPLPQEARIDELFVNGRERADLSIHSAKKTWRASVFVLVDRVLRVHERLPWKPFRRRALARAERWILERQEADGAWGGIQPPVVYSLIALKVRGHSTDEGPLREGFEGLYAPTGFVIRTEDRFRFQACLSPIWDTGLALLALEDAALPPDDPAIRRAAEWLLDKQIFTGGDWQVRSKARPGGWAFEFANDHYPDTDDTAVVMIALLGAAVDAESKRRALDRGREWLVGMQSRNGGWGAFDRNNTRTWPRQIPFCDFGEVIDPPSADVTAHVAECLGRLGADVGDPIIERALTYLKREQDSDGAWFGRWGVNLTYGIGAVLPAFEAVGKGIESPSVRRAVDWLLEHQNEDGGWGEKIEGYYDLAWRGRGESTPSQTAWALLGLVSAKEADHPATTRGIDYLVKTQREFGGWDEEAYTGSGFPTDFMIRYNLYRDVFPLMALGRYRRASIGGDST